MRVQLDFDEQGAQLLETLKQKTASRTQRELFNNALTLLDWAIKQREQGYSIASVDETNQVFKELQMPALEYAAAGQEKSAT
ncbi:MAG: hypothetical protein ACJ71W_00380 [Terriglobales bacterium]